MCQSDPTNTIALSINIRNNSFRPLRTSGRKIPNTIIIAPNPIAAPIIFGRKKFFINDVTGVVGCVYILYTHPAASFLSQNGSLPDAIRWYCKRAIQYNITR